jgi:phenylalanyl-tRNA synthetase beta chain
MPVVTLYLQRLQKLVGAKATKRQILDALPFLGLDIEEQTEEYVRVEYSPNRPDYATDLGIAAGLQGLLGIKSGMQEIKILRGDTKFSIKVEPAVKRIRPYIVAIVAKGGNLDDESVRQIIALQEDLHFGIGRRRKKSSIGIHNLDAVSFPLLYCARSGDHKFTPLGAEQEMSASQIIEKMSVGQEYGGILEGKTKMPIILDGDGKTVSFPPIINSALTTVSTSTKNLLVEVTGNDKSAVEDSLSVIASALQGLGFALHDVKINLSGSSGMFKARTIALDPKLVNRTLGLNLSTSQICVMLKKCRLDAKVKGAKILCTVPRFRFDIFGPMDLVEEVMLGYGIQNFVPVLPVSSSVGQKNPHTVLSDTLGQIMIGLGFTEILNSSLSSRRVLYEQAGRTPSDVIEVAESKSQEHTILRDAMLPGVLETLSRNVHEQYPQKLFEMCTIFEADMPIKESVCLACVSAHKDSGYTEIKSTLQSLLKTFSGIECKTKTSSHPIFAKGKAADVMINGKKIGIIGEVDSKIIDGFKIRVPVSAFEISVSELQM